ncbi:MAG: CRISPR-associated protein Cas4 [Candidatus Delongbacteria bacterium]|jgi:CRISPR-associated exonuclease Cas4|nr:CRISPR-associated protein Cas4 [Candidatus Delongbacteria bacterium]
MTEPLHITGCMINYFFICKRKLWYFCNQIQMEHNSELVEIGKIIDETSYGREKKSIMIDNTICIDFIDGKGVINEVKKSNSMEDAHIWQLKYYLYYLKLKGVTELSGSIDYPKLKKRIRIELNEEDVKFIETMVCEIQEIKILVLPPVVINSKICKKCSYYELCYI